MVATACPMKPSSKYRSCWKIRTDFGEVASPPITQPHGDWDKLRHSRSIWQVDRRVSCCVEVHQ